MITFYSFGRTLELMNGSMRLAQLYAGGAIAGGLLQLPRLDQFGMGLGASSAISAIVIFDVMRRPFDTVILFVFPMPSWALGLMFMTYSMLSMNSGSSYGHAAHFGGGMFGAAMYFMVKKRMIR